MTSAQSGTAAPLGPAMARGAGGRIVLLDAARGVALVGMAAFHLTYDLALFRLIPSEVVAQGYWPLHARIVAGSFLFLSGLSLWLAHGCGIRWAAFGRRFLRVAGAAALVSLATRLALGEAWVFFGILHAIALCTALALLVLRWPVWAVLALAAAVFWAGWSLALPAFDAGPLLWLGLGAAPVWSVDYVPLFPWLAPVLAGVAVGRIGAQAGLWARLAARPAGPVIRALAWPGRHSLAVYLIHQPVIIGLLLAGLWLAGRLPQGL